MVNTHSLTNASFPGLFPFEILAEIIKCFAGSFDEEDDERKQHEEMKKIALVSKQFCAISRAHIFQKLELDQDCDNKPQRRSLALLLQKNPHLTHRVQSVVYTFHLEDETVPTTVNKSLSSILLLPNVKELTIRNRDAFMHIPNYDDVPKDPSIFTYRLLVENFLDRGTLTTLELSGINNIPLNTILSFPTLTSLFLFGCSVQSTPPLPAVTSASHSKGAQDDEYNLKRFQCDLNTIMPVEILAQCPNLEYLQGGMLSFGTQRPIRSSPLAVSPTSSILPFRKLREAHFYGGIDIDGWVDIATKPEICDGPTFPSLREMFVQLPWIQPGHVRGYYEDQLHRIFSNTSALETLTLSGGGLTEPAVNFSRVLQPINTSLETLTLNLTFDIYHTRDLTVQRFKALVDDILTLRLPILKQLHLQIFLETGCDEKIQLEVLHQVLEVDLPRLKPAFKIDHEVVSTTPDTTCNFPLLRVLDIDLCISAYGTIAYRDMMVLDSLEERLNEALGALIGDRKLDCYSCSGSIL